MKTIEISVIIPVYQAEESIHKCIESIRTQTFEAFEIILINDGSTDNSGKICEQYRSLDKRISVIHQENAGVSISRNRGIEKALGTYICFVDSDDYIEKDMLFKLYEASQRNESHLSCCGFKRVFYKGEHVKKEVDILPDCKDIQSEEAFKTQFGLLYEKTLLGAVYCKLYRSEIIKKKQVRFRSDIYIGEDFLFNQEYLKYGTHIGIVNQSLYYYICKDNGSLTKKVDLNKEKYNRLLFEKSCEFSQSKEMWEETKSYISKLYLRSCFINIEQVFGADIKMELKDKRKYVEKIVYASETCEAVEVKKNKDLEHQLYRIFLKTKNITLIMSFAYFRLIFKKIVR
jgi:Glycosyltransferases involved in cell wall biogenesis